MTELWDILQKWIIEEGTDQQNGSVPRDQKVLTVEMKSDSSVNRVIEQLSWPQESWHCSHWRNSGWTARGFTQGDCNDIDEVMLVKNSVFTETLADILWYWKIKG